MAKDITESHDIGLVTPSGEEEIALCNALDNAIQGGIPFDSLPNHGVCVTSQREIEACERFKEFLVSDLAAFICKL